MSVWLAVHGLGMAFGFAGGLFVGLAIVAVIAAKPQFLATTFTGANNLLKTSISPVTGTK